MELAERDYNKVQANLRMISSLREQVLELESLIAERTEQIKECFSSLDQILSPVFEENKQVEMVVIAFGEVYRIVFNSEEKKMKFIYICTVLESKGENTEAAENN